MSRLLVALLVTLLAALPARAMDIQRIVSPGGIEAWLVEEHAVPLLAVSVGFRGGAGLEPEGREGLAGMLAALLDQGAGPLDAEAFQERLAATAIDLDFGSDRDTFYGSFATLTEHRDEAFSLLSYALTAPRFDAAPLERVRGQAQARLARESEDPESIAAKRWYAVALPNHPYGRPSHGTKESIAAIAADDLRAFAGRVLARDRLKVAVVGDIDKKTLARLLDKTFAALPATSPPDAIAEAPPLSGPRLVTAELAIPQSVVMFGTNGIKRDDPDFYAAYVLNYIVGGGGFASRLMQEIREKRGLAYSVYTGLLPLDHVGLTLGSVSTDNNHVKESIALIKAELTKVVATGATAQELVDAKTYLTGSYPLRFDTNAKIATELLGVQLESLGIDYVNKRNDFIEAVTLEDLKRVAPRILDPGNLLVTVVGNPKGL